MKVRELTPLQRQIVTELSQAVVKCVGRPEVASEVQAVLASWGESLREEHILAMLQSINLTGSVFMKTFEEE